MVQSHFYMGVDNRVRQQISGGQGLGGKGWRACRVTANGFQVSLGADGNVLELGSWTPLVTWLTW